VDWHVRIKIVEFHQTVVNFQVSNSLCCSAIDR